MDFRLDAHIRGDLILLSLVSLCRFLLMLGCVHVLIFVHVWKLDCVYMYIFLMCSLSFTQIIVLPFGQALVADPRLKFYCADASLHACSA